MVAVPVAPPGVPATLRYQTTGVDVETLIRYVPAGVTVSIASGPEPITRVDILVSDGVSQGDLDAIMVELGWEPTELNPPPLPAVLQIKQNTFATQAVDVSTVSIVFVDLFSVTLTTEADFLDCQYTASVEAVAAGMFMQLELDGVAIPGTGSSHGVGTLALCGRAYVAIAAGAHTVKLRWRVDVLGTANLRPVTLPDAESATLMVRELGT